MAKKDKARLRVLVVDIGGTNVKLLATGEKTPRKFPSGTKLTPKKLMAGIAATVPDWQYDAVSIGYPGRVHRGKIVEEPFNLGKGWMAFNFKSAFGKPVRIINDAAMQAMGSYKKGTLLFLGLGTSLGAALIVDGIVIPMELAHISYKNATYQEYFGNRALHKLGRKKWQKNVEQGTARLREVVFPDDVVIGGGNASKLKGLPEGCREGKNANAFAGGFRMWDTP